MVIDGALTGPHFLAYLRQILLPVLKPGDIVVMDNLATHKIAAIVPMLAEHDAKALYLPPYSPDFNPIEQAFSQVKATLRRKRLRTVDELWQAFGQSLDWVTTTHAKNYFRNSDYLLE
jgi:transposase